MSPLVFRVAGNTYRMSPEAMGAFRALRRDSTEWESLVGCDGCGTVCFLGHLCRCGGHYGRNDYANHRVVRSVAEVVVLIREIRRAERAA